MAAVVWAVAAFFLGMLLTLAGVLVWRPDEQTRAESEIDYELLIDAVDDALLVIDETGNIQMTNDTFDSLFDRHSRDTHIDDVFVSYPEISEQVTASEQGIVTATISEETHHLELCQYAVEDETELILFHDVTEREQHKQALEEKNEQLDQFASLISHDLRNPLDVAIGRTNAVAEMSDNEKLETHFESIQNALTRMHRIITDVLALARQGEDIGEMSSVGLESTATDAWSHVQTNGASLTVERDMTVMANREGLEHIFENLFRNAVQHGGENVSVRVGIESGDDGFFVADDGIGVPADKRDQILEAGYTDSEEGTGLGLAIVTSIAEAHGWEISVGKSDSGGAQFTFSGVERATSDFLTQEGY